jgi:hypothetical protein
MNYEFLGKLPQKKLSAANPSAQLGNGRTVFKIVTP